MLGADYRILPCKTSDTTTTFALWFFDGWYCEHGLPNNIFSNCDKLFLSQFWKALTHITGVKLKMSTAYHPQTDGSSERTNKTLNQAICYHVSCNQLGWVCVLPRIRFDMMNTVNASTGFSGFQLLTGQLPRIIPSLTALPPSPAPTGDDDAVKQAMTILQKLEDDVQAAKDNLLLAKVTQVHQKNKHRSPEKQYAVGDKVMLLTFHRRREYVQKGQNRVTKFMPRFDGPYTITRAFPIRSVYAIDMPNCPNLYSTFHTPLLKPFIANDPLLFPSWIQSQPDTVVTENGEEWFINRIVDEWKRGRGYQYLV